MSTMFKKKEVAKNFNKYLKNNSSTSTFYNEFENYINDFYKEQSSYEAMLDFVKKDEKFEEELNNIFNTDLNLKKLGSEIKRLRLAQGWSTYKLAELSEMSLGFINQLENGKSSMPKASSLTRLAKIFNIDPNKFLYLAGYINIEPTTTIDWKITIINQLSDIGIKDLYISEIIDYIETVQIKQSRKEEQEK